MTTPEELIAGGRALILDFDGPITALMPPPANAEAADQVRDELRDLTVPGEVQQTTDHLAVLRWTANTHPSRLGDVERACTAVEVACALVSKPSDELPWLLDLAKINRLPVGIASNNSELSVRTFVERIGWSPDGFACRTPDSVRLLKPHPAFVLAVSALLGVSARESVFVGDSITDVQAGKAAGARVLAIAKSRTRFAELVEAGADVTKMGSSAAC